MMKKFKKIAYALGIFMAVISVTACEKYLNVQSNDGLVIPKDLESLQKLLDYSSMMNVGIGSCGEVSADDYFIQESVYATLADWNKKSYIWQNDHLLYPNDWSRGYIPVYTCNLVLQQVEKIKETPDQAQARNQVLGSALFYRANQYLSLLWNYAKAYNSSTAASDLGIVLRNTADFNEKSSRSSVQVCYDQIIHDLRYAVELLPDQATHTLRASKAAAYGVLSRTYLSMAKYDSAYYYADQVLAIKNDLLDFNNPAEVDLSSDFPFARFNKETVAYFELTAHEVFAKYADILVDTVLYNSYDPDDLRRQAYFLSGSTGYAGSKGNYAGAPSYGIYLFGGLATDEFYLIRAECLARAGKLADAQDDLNQLLVKRYKTGTFQPYALTDQQQVIKLILQERRKELFLRGVRWIDIKRLNLEGANIAIKRIIDGKEYILMPNANRFALPLPIDIIRETGMPQNPT